MRVIIKPIIKPVNNPTLNYREFDDVEKVISTNNNYVLLHKDGLTKIEFHLPDNCYLIEGVDEENDVLEIFKALDKYFKDVAKANIPSALENLVGQYIEYADLKVDWIEIC